MADDLDTSAASRESAEVKNDAELVRLWLDALQLASVEEEQWRQRAQDAIDIYRERKRYGKDYRPNDGSRTFNILHANIETIIPAVYNSTPIPDVRRRFNDEDPAGKEVADILERALSFSVDSYDFDDTIRHDIKDMELTGRGLSRIRYVPYLGKNGPGVEQSEEPEGQEGAERETTEEGVLESGKELGETLDYEEVICEHVAWKHFRKGPARTWPDVPWIAFELFLTREELIRLSPEDGNRVELDTTIAGSDKRRDGENIKEVFKRARVWEIWDKESRKVLFIAPGFKEKPIKSADDPLDLMQFFPIPKPLYAIETSDNLIPVIPYDIYRDQAEELERVSRRIMALVESIKSRGIYDGSMHEIDRLSEADDNTLIAVENVARYADGSGIEKGIAWWPTDPAVKALAQLVEHRERIKQTIYEITGISDILRGQTEASETATAQQIKQQWGSLRIQTKQVEIQRYARDLFRLKAEIIANKFQWETISLMTGLDYPTKEQKAQAQAAVQQQQAQAQQTGQPIQIPAEVQKLLSKPAREDVEQLLRNDATRGFRVDVESDSTIRADMTRNQQNMTLFLQGTAQFAQAMGPIVMAEPQLKPVVMEVFSAFARNFKLGKQAEDAIDNVADKARDLAANPPPQQPNPEQIKAQAAAQQAQMDLQAAQQKHSMEMEKMQAELEIKKQELALKERELQMKAQSQQIDLQVQQQKHAMDAAAMDRRAQFDASAAAMDMERSQREHELGMQATETKHQFGMEAMKAKAAAAKQPARAGA